MLTDPMRMNAEFLQRMDARCRDLANRTQNEAGREELRFWAAEFEEQAPRADIAEHAESG